MHKSVLLTESIEELKINSDGIYVDATLGYAGHSKEILKRLETGKLYAFDQDEDAIKSSTKRLSKISDNFEIIKSNFVNLKTELEKRNVTEVNGILFDLGVSSPQLDQKDRGFSFHEDALLDMRMDKDASLTAKDVVNNYSKGELIRIMRDYGEEKYASSIASGILNYREDKEIETTLELVEIIKSNVPEKYKRDKHPARKVFQAIRIEVNDELNVCKKAVTDALDIVNVGGRVAVITFHSLEDKIVKKIFTNVTKVDSNLKGLPVIPEKYLPSFKSICNLEPSKKELEENNRSRSARLRVVERIK